MQSGEKTSGDKMAQSQKSVFLYALIVTIVIFGLGIVSGILLENSRINKMDDLYTKSETQLLDLKLVNLIYSQGFYDCEFAEQENIKFADNIYEEAETLEKYESASRLDSESLQTIHKKYDILRAMLFVNSLEIKENCDSSYNAIVYFYKYNNEDLEIKSKQEVFSNLLFELKEQEGNNLLLIPIAGDTNISSVQILMNKYEIKESDLPLILINEKDKITELQNIEELSRYLNK